MITFEMYLSLVLFSEVIRQVSVSYLHCSPWKNRHYEALQKQEADTIHNTTIQPPQVNTEALCKKSNAQTDEEKQECANLSLKVFFYIHKSWGFSFDSINLAHSQWREGNEELHCVVERKLQHFESPAWELRKAAVRKNVKPWGHEDMNIQKVKRAWFWTVQACFEYKM